MAFRDELVEWFRRDPCAKEQFRLGRVYGAVMVNPNGGAAIEIAGLRPPSMYACRPAPCPSCGANQTEVRRHRRRCAYCGGDR